MKSLKFIVVGLVSLFLMTSCNREPEYRPIQLHCKLIGVNTYNKLGNHHNSFLTNIDQHFKPDSYPSNLTYDERINKITAFNQAHVASLGLNDANSATLSTELANFSELLDKNVAYDRFFVETDILANHDLYQIVDELETMDIIDAFERQLVHDMLDLVDQNHSGLIDVYSLKEELKSLKSDWVAKGYTTCDKGYGRFSLMVLSISLSSADWWIAHPNAHILRAVPWVAADVGGAIYGAGAGALGSTIIDEFSWKATGWAAVAGGVGASTGIAGKIGGWIFGSN